MNGAGCDVSMALWGLAATVIPSLLVGAILGVALCKWRRHGLPN